MRSCRKVWNLPPLNRKETMRMKRRLLALTLAVLPCLAVRSQGVSLTNTTGTASAMPKQDYGNYNDYNYAGHMGAGIILGEPIGGSVKYWLNNSMAIDGALGWSSGDHSEVYLHSDFLYHEFHLFPVSSGRLPLYLGGGVLARFRSGITTIKSAFAHRWVCHTCLTISRGRLRGIRAGSRRGAIYARRNHRRHRRPLLVLTLLQPNEVEVEQSQHPKFCGAVSRDRCSSSKMSHPASSGHAARFSPEAPPRAITLGGPILLFTARDLSSIKKMIPLIPWVIRN